MDTEILKKVLQLDSLISFLDWEERTQIHHYKEGETKLSKKVLSLYDWVLKKNWESPKRNYEHSRVLHFYDPDSDTWLPDEDYLKLYPEYKTELIKLKYH